MPPTVGVRGLSSSKTERLTASTEASGGAVYRQASPELSTAATAAGPMQQEVGRSVFAGTPFIHNEASFQEVP